MKHRIRDFLWPPNYVRWTGQVIRRLQLAVPIFYKCVRYGPAQLDSYYDLGKYDGEFKRIVGRRENSRIPTLSKEEMYTL